MAVRVDLNLSLDGVAAPADPTPENPMGADWGLITAAYVGTRTFRTRVLGDSEGRGTTGIDDRYAAAYFEGVGAEVMGAAMFGLHSFPDDPDWRGWWGEEPPFHCPVLVLTHTPRERVEFANGTSFEFLDATAQQALARAEELAGGQDVRVGGGVGVVREFLTAGLVDRLHVALAPVVLGRGGRLWDDVRLLTPEHTVRSEVSESGTVHVTFER
ncbi:dihydrofolate reductase family protein [Lapillicoccus jejuensis]|uniref:Dihydrofolate reductase n=1 Tax=Lapillicoccus jejuensis TaxID=402171 RepID=A0A542DWD5_9MICO|nr:dihydrofolate reductase family protein [Lapillicoccus jejuensis]TQJ07402.1 dihydrofolate reductase [Lapillicoccus jejuensis]